MIKFKLDIKGLETQIEKVKKNIILGIHDGQIDAQDFMVGIMKFYIDEIVYNSYNPKVYERTYDLLNSVTSKVEGTTLYVYVDDSSLDKPNGSKSYAWRVLEGNDIYPYDFPVEGAGFMGPRDWVVMTREEFISHANQNKWYIDILASAVKRRL